MRTITENRFDPKKTKTIIIHDGRFHADDMMFAALALSAGELYKNRIAVKRLGALPEEYQEDVVVGDIGLGIYDHHTGLNGDVAEGAKQNTEDHLASACGLLYQDIKDILFQGESETKAVFEAFIDIIEHCDNTSDNNTFSDSINFMSPVGSEDLDDAARRAISYCKSVVNGFIDAHNKERKGKMWAIPRVCKGIVPGINSKKDTRYWKANNKTKNRYRYVSYNNKEDIKLRAMDTYSLACGVLSQQKRQYWRNEIERCDQILSVEMERREKEEWPKAVSEMKNKTIYLEQYVPYGQYVKDTNALFLVMPSQRGGYTITFLRTNDGKYRFDPEMLVNSQGVQFIANDKRLILFDSKENALQAAYMAGSATDEYLKQGGYNAYREIYGGIREEEAGDFFQKLISEDIALNIYAMDHIKDLNQVSINEYRNLQAAIIDNPYAIHSFCTHFDTKSESMRWEKDVSVTDTLSCKGEAGLLKKTNGGQRWNLGMNVCADVQQNYEGYKDILKA